MTWSPGFTEMTPGPTSRDRKSTRLNSSHVEISYAVFCLTKNKAVVKGSDLCCHMPTPPFDFYLGSYVLLELGAIALFFNNTATTEIYTLSLHDALPISESVLGLRASRYRPSASILSSLGGR